MKVGLCTHATRTGLGYMAYDIARMPWLTDWLVCCHPLCPDANELIPENVREHSTTPSGVTALLDAIDCLIVLEVPIINSVVTEASKRGVKVCHVPMTDTFVVADWMKSVDMIWAPTGMAVRGMKEQLGHYKPGVRLVGGRWGIDPHNFQFTQRDRAARFLFSNGQGGGNFNRKGADTFVAAARQLPGVDFVFHSQTERNLPADMPGNVTVIVEDFNDRAAVYAMGDVFLAPTKWEGIGLQLYEAQSCGLPVIATDGAPMNEARGFARIAAGSLDLKPGMSKRYDPRVESLVEIIDRVNGTDISVFSHAARRFASTRCNVAHTLQQLGDVLKQ